MFNLDCEKNRLFITKNLLYSRFFTKRVVGVVVKTQAKIAGDGLPNIPSASDCMPRTRISLKHVTDFHKKQYPLWQKNRKTEQNKATIFFVI